MALDLSAIAKGWAVDAMMAELPASRFAGLMVHVGGEVAVAGTRPDGTPWGTPWRRRFERPTDDPTTRSVHDVVRLTHGGLATSGFLSAGPQGGRPAAEPHRRSVLGAPGLGTRGSGKRYRADLRASRRCRDGPDGDAPDAGMVFVETPPWLEALLVLRDGERVGARRASLG